MGRHTMGLSANGTHFIPYEYPKDNETELHTALTAAAAGSGIMFDSPL